MTGLEMFKKALDEGMKELMKRLDAQVVADLTGAPIEELLPQPKPPPYDPNPLHDAIVSDSLVCGTVAQHGHGASEEYAILGYKDDCWAKVSADDYKEPS